MPIIDFPIKISEIGEMRKDGDNFSLFFSYSTIVCIVLFVLLLSIHSLLHCEIFKVLGIISISLSALFWLAVYIYRPIFLTDETKKQKGRDRILKRKFEKLNELKGQTLEEAIRQLSPTELEQFTSYATKETARQVLKRTSKS